MREKIIVHYAKADRLEAGGFNPVCGKSICETAAKDDTIMPWTRGARRAAYIAKRNAAPLPLKKAA
jgi:hypothetical protein